MTMPFYVAPEQVMKDRAEYAQKGIARGRSLVATVYDDGILIVAENPSRSLHKISEIYDRIAFAGVGKYNEFDQLRVAGVRHADTKGFAFSREDVDARSLANLYAQYLGNVFTHEMKPLEVEILVAELGADGRPGPAVPHRLRGHDHRRGPLRRARRRGRDHRRAGGRAPAQDGWDLAAALRAGRGRPGRPRPDARAPSDLEVAVLSRQQRPPGLPADRRRASWPAPRLGAAGRRRPAEPRRRRPTPARAPPAADCRARAAGARPGRRRRRRRRRSVGAERQDTGLEADRVGTCGAPRDSGSRRPGDQHRHYGGRGVDRRIFGLENEYGVTCTLRGQRRLSPDEVARYLFRRVVSWGRSSNVFLENGARLYLDVGSHPEYATPECDSIADLVAHDKAGERILDQLVTGAEARLREEGIRGVVYLFKNNTDSAGNSYGCHENYLTERDDDFAHYTEVLIPFLVSRQIFAGAGKVLQTARGAVYCISQRAEHIWEGVSSATTRSRPIINTRDEPHADAERFRRLHVIVGDSNMSEYATFLKVGTTSILLRMLEDPSTVLRDLTLENPIRAIREISHDITCRRRVRLANGREMRRPRHPDRVPRAGPALPGHATGSSPEEDRALDMWEHCLKGLESDPLSLWRECDWVVKYRLVEEVRERHDLPLSHPKVALVDLSTTTSTASRGLFYQLQAPRPGRADLHRRRHRHRHDPGPRRPPGPGCGASSSGGPRSAAGTSPWTGSTSSSTTRRSARCC